VFRTQTEEMRREKFLNKNLGEHIATLKKELLRTLDKTTGVIDTYDFELVVDYSTFSTLVDFLC